MPFRLTNADRYVLEQAARPETGGVAALTKWYLNIEPFPYQFAYTHALQKRILLLAAIRSGKTFATAMRNFYKCMMIPWYKFLNTSISTDQASVMYWILREMIEANERAEKFVDALERRPFPKITFVNGSQMDFRSVGYQAELLRTLEWDAVNIDEAGWVDDYYTIQVLMGRTIGVRPNGIPREGTLSVTTSPTSAPWLREWVDKGTPPTRRYLTLRATIRDNIALDRQVVDELFDDYDPELAKVELMGQLPELAEAMFPPHVVTPCMDGNLNDELDDLCEDDVEGAVKIFDPKLGVVRYEKPYDPDGHYILSADLGTQNITKRGASVLFVLNMAEEPYELVAFNWISGNGEWGPGLQALQYLVDKYRPVEKALDTTGAQTILAELLSSRGVDVEGFRMNQIKDEMLTATQLALQRKKIRMPYIKEVFRELTNYRLPDKKLVQDAVMALAQLVYLTRFVQPKDEETFTVKRIYQGRSRKGRVGRVRTERRR